MGLNFSPSHKNISTFVPSSQTPPKDEIQIHVYKQAVNQLKLSLSNSIVTRLATCRFHENQFNSHDTDNRFDHPA